MKGLNYIAYGLALLLAACTNEEELPTPTGETLTATVPITISLGGNETTDTKAAPPSEGEQEGFIGGQEEVEGIDRVRLITFRRKDMDDIQTGGNTEPFLYDPTNDQVITELTWDLNKGDNGRLVAQGNLHMIYGYEYRVVGLSYASAEEEDFTLNIRDGLSLEELSLSVVEHTDMSDLGEFLHTNYNDKHNENYYDVPQIFYGYCYQEDREDPIIKFEAIETGDGYEQDEEGNYQIKPLTGVLYRGMAKVVFTLNIDDKGAYIYQAAGLLAKTIFTQTRLTTYDDFLQPIHEVSNYTMIDYQSMKDQSVITFTAYILPGKAKLALRLDRTGLGELVHSYKNYPIAVKDLSSAEGATGIISPDAHDDYFYFRRNHKYVLSGNLSTILDSKNGEL